MTDMYEDKAQVFEGKLDPFPHAERPARGRADDPVAYLRGNEQRARERQVAYETVKLLRQKVIQCYRVHGVNHYEECKGVGQAYYDLISKKDLGQLQPAWSDPKKMDGW